MGLAGAKNKRRLGNDPNNNRWSRNTESFGQKMLRSQGWEPGQYLGAKDAAHAENYGAASASHIQVVLKDDTLGLGAKRNNGDECTGLFDFQHLLGRLNGKSEEALESELKKREDMKLNSYLEQRLGTIRFVRGGWLVGDVLKEEPQEGDEKPEASGAQETSRESAEESAEPEPSEPPSKKRKAEQDTDKDDEKARTKEKKSKKRKTESDVETDCTDSKERKKDKKSKKRKADSEEGDPEPTESKKSSKREKKKDEPVDEVDMSAEDAKKKKKEKKEKKEKREGKEKKDKKKKDRPASDSSAEAGDSISKEKRRRKEKNVTPAVDSGASTPSGSGYSTPVTTTSRYLARSRFIAQKKMAFTDSTALNQIFMIKS